MPLIYLLLDRDLKIFRVAQHKLLSDDELWDSAESLLWVYDTIALRSNDLRGNILPLSQALLCSKM